MSTTLTLIVIWSIVALIFYCCYRLWYWTPIATTQTNEVDVSNAADERRAA